MTKDKFDTVDPNGFSEATKALAKKVAVLDASLSPREGTRRYHAALFRRNLEMAADFPRWSEKNFLGTYDIPLDDQDYAEIDENRKVTFQIPPGHFRSRKREEETIHELSRILKLDEKG